LHEGVVVVRFPNGDAEINSGSVVPSTGDRLSRGGTDWVVAGIDIHAEGRTTVSVVASEVQRDQGWPTPYEFVHLS
jgi:hypothetical protein